MTVSEVVTGTGIEDKGLIEVVPWEHETETMQWITLPGGLRVKTSSVDVLPEEVAMKFKPDLCSMRPCC